MKKFLQFSKRASKGAALIIVLAFVVLLTGLAVAYFSRTTTDRQLAQSSYNDTTADLLARSALDITVGDLSRKCANTHASPQPIFSQPLPDGDRRQSKSDPPQLSNARRAGLRL